MDILALMVLSWLVVSVWLAQLSVMYVPAQLHALNVLPLHLYSTMELVILHVLIRHMIMERHVHLALLHA